MPWSRIPGSPWMCIGRTSGSSVTGSMSTSVSASAGSYGTVNT